MGLGVEDSVEVRVDTGSGDPSLAGQLWGLLSMEVWDGRGVNAMFRVV